MVSRSLIVNGVYIGSGDRLAESFSSGFEPISTPALSGSPTGYVTQAGDTLQSIAKAVWGDASLWYLIANANNISNTELAATPGQTLVIPQRVSTVSNNYATYKPYDPVKALGDIDPSLPIPAQAGGNKGCGIIGQLIVVVVAVAVTYFTAGQLGPEAFEFASSYIGAETATAAVAAAAGSVVSQGVGLALGIQDKFSWKGVALSALGGGISGGLNGIPGITGSTPAFGTSWVAAAERAVVGSIATQGIAVATGLQKQFSWSAVAAAGIGSAVGSSVNSELKSNNFAESLGTRGAEIARASLSGFAAGLTGAILRGGRVQVTQIATDAFGNALGSSLGEALRPTESAPQKSFAEVTADRKASLYLNGASNGSSGNTAAAQIEAFAGAGGYDSNDLENAGYPRDARFATTPTDRNGNDIQGIGGGSPKQKVEISNGAYKITDLDTGKVSYQDTPPASDGNRRAYVSNGARIVEDDFGRSADQPGLSGKNNIGAELFSAARQTQSNRQFFSNLFGDNEATRFLAGALETDVAGNVLGILKESEASLTVKQTIKFSDSVSANVKYDFLNGKGSIGLNGSFDYFDVSGKLNDEGKYTVQGTPKLGGYSFDLFSLNGKGQFEVNSGAAGGLFRYANDLNLPDAFPDTKTRNFRDVFSGVPYSDKVLDKAAAKFGDVNFGFADGTVSLSRSYTVGNTKTEFSFSLSGTAAAGVVTKIIAAGIFGVTATGFDTTIQQYKYGSQNKKGAN